MTFHRFAAWILVSLAIAARPSVAPAESWPELGEYVPKCPLILHVRTAPSDIRRGDGQTLCSVVEALKGEYRPDKFVVPPPTGFVRLSGSFQQASDSGALDLITFYGHNSINAKGQLSLPDMTLVVRDGSIKYPPEGELVESKSFKLADFTKHIKAIASDVPRPRVENRPEPSRQVTRRDDLAGAWRVFLPAGFEHEIRLTHVAGERYEMAPKKFVFSGIYERQGDEFVLVESTRETPIIYRWHIHSRHLMSMKEQKDVAGLNYVGAALFRPKE